jgi:DNA polymerase III delta subunit
MITILVGNDYVMRGETLRKQRQKLTDEGYDVSSFFADEHEMLDIISSLTHETLFGDTNAYVLHGCLQDEEVVRALAIVKAPLLCIEETLNAVQIRQIKKYATGDVVVEKFTKKKNEDKQIFKLMDHICARNPKDAWLTYQSLVGKGQTAHQMIGLVWWQVKNMLLVSRGEGEHLGFFLASKAQGALRKYDQKALDALAHKILDIYHRGHQGENIDNLFEEFLLTIHQ